MNRVGELGLLARSTGVQLRWAPSDPYPWLTRSAAVGLALAGALAVFGLPPISIHGPLHFLGVMDPLCGMTRGTVATVRGDLRAAITFNPMSPGVPFAAAAVLVRWIGGCRTGRWLCLRYVARPVPVALTGVALAALAVNQQLHADLLGG